MNDRDCDNCAHHSEGGCSVWECIFKPKEDDTISRQAAIGAICGECQANCIPCESFPCGEIKAIQALPSVQPEIIRCKDCKHSEFWYRDKRRCFLWHEEGIDVFEDGFCNYAERKTDEQITE